MPTDKQILYRIKANDPTLTELDLSSQDPKLTDSNIIALAKALAHNTNITTLDLKNNLISNEGVSALVSNVSDKVKSLNLNRNQINDEGAALLQNHNFKALYIFKNEITPELRKKIEERRKFNNLEEEQHNASNKCTIKEDEKTISSSVTKEQVITSFSTTNKNSNQRAIELEQYIIQEIANLKLSNEQLKNEVSKLQEQNKILSLENNEHEKRMQYLTSKVKYLEEVSASIVHVDKSDKIVKIQAVARGFFDRKRNSLSELKSQRMKEIQAKMPETMSRLVGEGKFEELANLTKAVRDNHLHEAIQIIRGIPEKEIHTQQQTLRY